MLNLQLRCQQTDTGIKILQAYSDHTHIHIPGKIRGLPVTEIGPYCFSASRPGRAKEDSFFYSSGPDKGLDEGLIPGSPGSIEKATLPAADGKYLEEIYLPSSVSVLHNGAFYNCRKLSVLGFGAGLCAIGSDVFTNCTSLARLYFTGQDEEASALSLILGRLEMELTVLFCHSDLQVTGSLFFPEYYEWLDEVSPAHLFSRSIHGEGFRMRKCFRDGQIDYGKYDACFDNALKTESEAALCQIALCRLRWPAGLLPAQKQAYEDALSKRFTAAIDLAVRARDLTLLRFLMDFLYEFNLALDKCIKADWGEGAALVMEERRRQNQTGRNSMIEKNYDFDDLF